MPETIHVLLTDYGHFGWGISSPQLPELIGGRETQDELVTELDQLLEFGGAEPGAPRVIHLQEHVELANGDELLVRVAQDEKREERRQVSLLLIAAMRIAGQLTDMLKAPRRPTGELLFVCVQPNDSLGWISAQFSEKDAGCLVLRQSENIIQTLFVAHGEDPTGEWNRAADMGWTADTTVSELFQAQESGKVGRSQLVFA